MMKIKIGQIGTGHGHASGKLEVYRKSDDYEVVGVAEPDDRLRRKAESNPAFRDVQWMSVEQLLNTPGLQAVAVETEPRHLLAHAEQCIDAGMHVHLDKPAGESLSQFRRILDTSARRHLCVQMGYMYRYNPAVVLCRDLVKKGFLGDPFEVHCVMSKQLDRAARLKHAEYRGGMMFELGCHLIDIVVSLLGAPDSVLPVTEHSSDQADELLDNMLAVLKYPRAIASVKSSGLEVEGFARRHFVLCGTEGTIHIEPLDSPKVVRLALSKERGKYRKGYQDVPVESYQRYVADAADFAKIIRGEKMSDWSVTHDLAVQETVLRAAGCPTDT
ncbi:MULTISPECIES: Gfo/Idh/MocA family protein [unclassified Schlesneria]|uniref:Gfo/Idh/MocA family protein n=1 Tax=unclassified Schlesneria TaxID=2762017 RepID=UPI002EFFFF4E